MHKVVKFTITGETTVTSAEDVSSAFASLARIEELAAEEFGVETNYVIEDSEAPEAP